MRKLQLSNKNMEVLVLNTYDDFQAWYLNCHDLSFFSKVDIDDLLQEQKPDSYPCVPLLAEDGFDAYYVSPTLITQPYLINLLNKFR